MNKVGKLFWYAGLALLAVAGFNCFYGPASIPSGYAEAFAVGGGLLIWLGAMFLPGAIVRIPAAAALALTFSVLFSMQSFFLEYANLTRVLSMQMYLLWAAILSVACLRFRDALGDEHFVISIAWAIFIGALTAALIGWAGLWGWEVHDGVHLYKFYHEGVLNGPLAQRNLFASSLVLGLISLAWVSISWKRQALILPSLGFVLGLPLMVTASRTGLLELMALFALGVFGRIAAGKAGNEAVQKFCVNLLLLLAVALVLQLLASPIMSVINPAGENAIQRLAGSVYASRWHEWQHALKIFTSHPWLGVGAGNYPWFNFLERATDPINGDMTTVAFTHCHNLILQVLAEMGLIGGVLLALCAWFWIKSWHGSFMAAPRLFLLLLSIPLLLHSMLEYPLWYANFLGVMILSATAWASWSVQLRFPRWMSFLFLGAGVLTSLWGGFVLYGLVRINHAIELDWQGQHEVAVREAVDISQQHLFMAPYASLLLVNRAVPGQDIRANQLYEAMAARVSRWIPYPESIYNQALWQASTGELDQAQKTLDQAVLVYPDMAKRFTPRWQAGSDDPAYLNKQKAFAIILQEAQAKALKQ